MAESNKDMAPPADPMRDVEMPAYDDVDEFDDLEPVGRAHNDTAIPTVVNRRNVVAESENGDMPPLDDTLEGRIVAALRSVYDPEIPVNIYELGLIYDIEVAPDFFVIVRMTLTTPNCPEAVRLPGEVEDKVRSVEGVLDCKVDIVWEPPWNPSYMSEAAKLELGMF